MPTIAELEAQLAQAQMQNATRGRAGSWDGGRTSAQIQNLTTQLNMLRSQQAAQGDGNREADMLRARDEQRNAILGLTEGRMNAVLNDPHTASALKFLGGVTSGQNTPFNATVRNNMLTSQAGMAAAAEGAQAQQLKEQMALNGMAMTDPAAQAALREIQSRRQGQVMQGKNAIDSQANIANFNAQMAGANNLASVRAGQNAQANSMANAAAGHRSTFFEDFDEGQRGGNGGTVVINPIYQQQGQQQAQGFVPTQQSTMARPAPTARPGLAGGTGRSGYTTAVQNRGPLSAGGSVQTVNPVVKPSPYTAQGTSQVSGLSRGTGYVTINGQQMPIGSGATNRAQLDPRLAAQALVRKF